MIADCNSAFGKYYIKLQFGGRNPEFGVNHVYRCLDYLVLCVLIDVYHFVLCVLMCIIFLMSLVDLFICYEING